MIPKLLWALLLASPRQLMAGMPRQRLITRVPCQALPAEQLMPGVPSKQLMPGVTIQALPAYR